MYFCYILRVVCVFLCVFWGGGSVINELHITCHGDLFMLTASEYTSLWGDTELRPGVLACLAAICMKLDDDTRDTGLAGFRSRPRARIRTHKTWHLCVSRHRLLRSHIIGSIKQLPEVVHRIGYTNIVCPFPPLLRRSCGRLVEWAALIRQEATGYCIFPMK
jgi:hypothetical protein